MPTQLVRLWSKIRRAARTPPHPPALAPLARTLSLPTGSPRTGAGVGQVSAGLSFRQAVWRWVRVRFRDPQQGGYVHDTAVSQFIGPMEFTYVTGTWAAIAGAVANTVCMHKAQADNTGVITGLIAIPQNGASYKGAYLKSIDVWWEDRTLAMDAVTAAIYKATLPATGDAFAAPAAVTFAYDSGHDTAPKRLTLDQHKMTLTITTPFWLAADDLVELVITADAGATSDFDFYGCRANFTLRL